MWFLPDVTKRVISSSLNIGDIVQEKDSLNRLEKNTPIGYAGVVTKILENGNILMKRFYSKLDKDCSILEGYEIKEFHPSWLRKIK